MSYGFDEINFAYNNQESQIELDLLVKINKMISIIFYIKNICLLFACVFFNNIKYASSKKI